jgi:regulator of telomere elongation helicase 1
MGDNENQLRYLKHIDYQEDKVKQQYKMQIDEVDIFFPMKPYECQLDYMQKVIQACKNGQNALLESPTGTGKTLCLLTAALAWLK